MGAQKLKRKIARNSEEFKAMMRFISRIKHGREDGFVPVSVEGAVQLAAERAIQLGPLREKKKSKRRKRIERRDV